MTARIFSKLILSLVAVLALTLAAVDYLVTGHVRQILTEHATSIDVEVRAIRNQVLGSTVLAFLPFVILAGLFARYISRRLGAIIEFTRKLAEGNFRARLPEKKKANLAAAPAWNLRVELPKNPEFDTGCP